jgi:hypothetical protein
VAGAALAGAGRPPGAPLAAAGDAAGLPCHSSMAAAAAGEPARAVGRPSGLAAHGGLAADIKEWQWRRPGCRVAYMPLRAAYCAFRPGPSQPQLSIAPPCPPPLQAPSAEGAPSLPQAAVLSGSWPTLRSALGWAAAHGIDNGTLLGNPGSGGLSPLQLLAAAPSAEALLAGLLQSCSSAALLWHSSPGGCGSSPAQLAAKAGRGHLNGRAAAALMERWRKLWQRGWRRCRGQGHSLGAWGSWPHGARAGCCSSTGAASGPSGCSSRGCSGCSTRGSGSCWGGRGPGCGIQ